MAKKEIIGYGVMDFDADKLVQFSEHKEDVAALRNRLLGVSRGGPAGSGDGPARDLELVKLVEA
jgi:hypothetical protein